ncbi:M3 family oligoendopeptidase [Candidatus Woesearchaeota archaeon]|jgi:oligoendopeptidase F|nr:M3 family oligoendopeptidase [Candidatus Woesearchaeota archaeon]
MIKKTEWNLDKHFDKTKFEEQRELWKKIIKDFSEKYRNDDSYLKDPKILKQALDKLEELETNHDSIANELYYYMLKAEKDKDNTEIKAKFNQIQQFSIEVSNQMEFFTLDLAKIPKEKQEEFLNDKSLKKYNHFLKKLFENAKYMLSEKEEIILNLKSQSSYSLWVSMVERLLSKEERETKDEEGKTKLRTYEELLSLFKSKDKKVRDEAAKAFNDILEKNVDVAEEEINAVLNNKQVNDSLRGLKRPDEARHVSDDIETEVVDTLIKTVEDNFDITKKYYELKAKLLNLKKLEYHERAIEYGEIDKKYTYEDSIDLVYKTFKNLDEEFAEIIQSFIENGQVDAFPKKGKSGGAFCAHMLKTQPTFILLNHKNKMDDVKTMAHEFGHGINNELMKKKQPALYFDTPKSTAEVASTFMEDFVTQELLKEANDETKLILLMEKLNAEISSVQRQMACYKFEQELHEEYRKSGHLSKTKIGEIFQKNMSAYMGDFVEQSPGSENWWVYWSHIRSFFYVYSYASGLLISKAMQSLVKKDPKNIEKVKEFLAAGSSESPKDIFMKLGIDITKKEFWEQGLQEIRDLLKETEELAKKLGKI